MKWSLTQLNKYKHQSFPIDETVNFENITDRKDVLSIDETNVNGTIHVQSSRIDCDLNIRTTVTMLDSRTSEEIEVPIEVSSFELFDENIDGEDIVDENVHPIDHTIDLTPIVRELIVVNIPNVMTKSELQKDSTENWTITDEDSLKRNDSEKTGDPRLSKLQNFFSEEKNSKED